MTDTAEVGNLPDARPFHLLGNYAPVEDELTEYHLEVDGSIPAMRKLRLFPGLQGSERVEVTSAALAVGQKVTLTLPEAHGGTLNNAMRLLVDTGLTTGALETIREVTL